MSARKGTPATFIVGFLEIQAEIDKEIYQILMDNLDLSDEKKEEIKTSIKQLDEMKRRFSSMNKTVKVASEKRKADKQASDTIGSSAYL